MTKPSPKSLLRRVLSITAVAGGTAGLLLTGIGGASAHVGATPDKTAANSYALVTFGIPHGCEHSGTTRVAITLPSDLDDAQPTINPNWTVEKVVEQLPAPKKLPDGTSISKRTSQIVYTAKAPLAPELRDALVLSMKLPDAAGKTLYFPTLQNCEQGQTDWSQIPAEGQDAHSLKSPAPSITVTEPLPAAGGHGVPASGGHGAPAADPLAGTTRAAAAGDDGAQARSWMGLAAGLGGLVLGGLALGRSRRGTPAQARVSAPGE